MERFKVIPSLTFVEALKLALNNTLLFKGRSRRSEYWWTMLAVFLVNVVFAFLPLLGWAISILAYIVTIPLTFRRLHDIGKSGWWFGISIIMGIVVSCMLVYDCVLVGINSHNGFDYDMDSVYALLAGKYLLLFLCGAIYQIVLLVFMCIDSSKGSNKLVFSSFSPATKSLEKVSNLSYPLSMYFSVTSQSYHFF